MLDHAIMKPESILVLKPHGPLSKEDFDGVTAAVDSYLFNHARLHGVMIQTKGFPGWEDFGGFAAHLRFVRDHHKKVDRIAIVTDNPVAGVAETLGKHFASADIMHFPYAEDGKALAWLETA